MFLGSYFAMKVIGRDYLTSDLLVATDASVNATQEMLTLGLCNIFGSFVSSMPTAGAFTRSAVGSASGVQTPMVGLYSGKSTNIKSEMMISHNHMVYLAYNMEKM